mgnify:CR=1 FL=1
MKTMSPQQLTANQRNAQKSTGPRTDTGRAVSKMNAFKHGIRSRQVLVRSQHFSESPSQFKSLHHRFVAELNPVGPVEEMLVDQIVTTHWRLRRALMAESGEIALSVERSYRHRRRLPSPQLQSMQWRAQGDPVAAMRESELGHIVLETCLDGARQAVERDGELTEAALQDLVQQLGGAPCQLTRDLEELRLRLAQNPDGLDPAALREENKAQALARLDRELERLLSAKKTCIQREAAEEEAHLATDVVPPLFALDRIMRYETNLERQLYRALSHLDRLQRRRQGEAVPPLAVEVSEKP